MTAQDRDRVTTSPHGVGGLPWWATLTIALVVLVPSTFVMSLPALVGAMFFGDSVVYLWLIMTLGTFGTVVGTVNSALCKAYGWWPVPVALVLQLAVAGVLTPFLYA
ncbi:hypothetical protein [Enemella sp. A6]|uniref:hypothetical protein n=1 Tax=Enemella sp. A6 TaxID=3440152 RepID=UPI003EBC332A